LPYEKRESLLSRGELAFYRVLRRAIPAGCSIAIKTRLADVMKCPDRLWDSPHGRKLCQKHVDFVLYDAWTARVLAAIELDDRTHESIVRRRRDDFVNSAFESVGVVLIRVHAAYYYDVADLQQKIAPLLADLDTYHRYSSQSSTATTSRRSSSARSRLQPTPRARRNS
jgi:hypothetical protein